MPLCVGVVIPMREYPESEIKWNYIGQGYYPLTLALRVEDRMKARMKTSCGPSILLPTCSPLLVDYIEVNARNPIISSD